jgi:carboxypeptidase family protein
MRAFQRSAAALLVVVLLPAAAFAQGAITGVVRDASGSVLPGVTVEAASPVLIEKVRSAITDDTGQYRILELRPGTYAVTFSLAGFRTVRREGIALSGDFVATVNADLALGTVEESVTVTGESPIVDVQSARVQNIIDRDVIAAIPTSRTANGIQAIIPGIRTGNAGDIGDSGGITAGGGGMAGSIHGARPSDSRTMTEGINMGWAGANSNAAIANVAGAQEVVVTTSGGLGEAETAGIVLNVIPRDGGNVFSGTFVWSGANDAMQGSNYTQKLKDLGLRSPEELIKVWDVNPMGGGPILRDRLWFYLTYREVYSENTVPGMWFNKNAGDPTKWTVDFDLTRPAFRDRRIRMAVARVTWQLSERNKININHSEQYDVANLQGGGGIQGGGGGTIIRTPEAEGIRLYTPGHIQQASWTSPFTNRLLFEAGYGNYISRYANFAPRRDGTQTPGMISVLEQCSAECPNTAGIPGVTYRLDAPLGGGFQRHQIGTRAQIRASVSYVPGAHNMKFGYYGGFSNPSQGYHNNSPFIQFRFNNGVPNQLTQTVVYPGDVKFVRNLIPTAFYAQDTWTRKRLTLQGGVRYDAIASNYPDSTVGGPDYQLMPTRIFYEAGSTEGANWKDVTPRMSAAYDLFGNARTAIKFNLGKYMQALTASNSDMDMNPLIRTALSTTRTWNDANRDYVPDCDLVNPAANGECGRMDNQNFGKEVFTRFFDPEFIDGWGKRGYNWELGLSVQQELMARVGLTVGYIRRWFGNFYTADNRLTTIDDYTPFSIPIPVDPRLPGGGGGTVSGLYNLVPGRVGQEEQFAELSSNIGKQIENWHGVDVLVNARLRNGLTVQGGTSTGRRLQDNCAVRATVPETYSWPQTIATQTARVTNLASPARDGGLQSPYCRVVEPFLTSFRGLVTYIVPKVDIQVSGTWRNDPGEELRADYVVTSAVAAPSLGRNLSSGNVTVNLIPPGTLYGDRRGNVDVRIAKILRFGQTRAQLAMDVYNLTNTDSVIRYNHNYVPSGAWLIPTEILPARYVRLNMQIDF